MKKCLCTLLDDGFVIAYKAFIKSFLHHNKWFDLDFVILDLGISDSNKKEMMKYYDKLIFKPIKYDNYKNVNMSVTHEKLKNTYYTCDVFSLYEYDRVVFMDMDIIVLQDMSDVFNCVAGFAACQSYNKRKDRILQTVNSGVFVVNKQFLNENEYLRIIEVLKPGHKMPDQATVNIYFNNRMNFLEKKYNCEKRIYGSKRYPKFSKPKDINIHYVGMKPWHKKGHDTPKHELLYDEFEKVWWEWYNK